MDGTATELAKELEWMKERLLAWKAAKEAGRKVFSVGSGSWRVDEYTEERLERYIDEAGNSLAHHLLYGED